MRSVFSFNTQAELSFLPLPRRRRQSGAQYLVFIADSLGVLLWECGFVSSILDMVMFSILASVV